MDIDASASDLLGPEEIATLLEVDRDTPGVWRRRGLLPPPETTISSVPVWRRSVIEAWARKTDRWPG